MNSLCPSFFFFFLNHKLFVFLLTPILRKDPYHGFTLKERVLGWRNQASMANAILLCLFHGSRIITVTTTLSRDGKTSQGLHHVAQGGGGAQSSPLWHWPYNPSNLPQPDPVSSSGFPQPGPLLSSLADLGPGLVAGGSSFLEIHLVLTSFPVL